MKDDLSDLNVSLEDHLSDVLRPLLPVLPPSLATRLTSFVPRTNPDVSQPPPPTLTIPYNLLLSISKWSRTPSGLEALASFTPPLDPGAYTMLALLAGTRSAPDRKFPAHARPPDPANEARREVSDRRAVIAVVNALLSVVCLGAATWWAARYTGWRDEWKVLLSLLAAVVVAGSEIGLYIIWEARREGEKTAVQRRLRAIAARRKKRDSSPNGSLSAENANASPPDDPPDLGRPSPLRQRVGTRSTIGTD